MKDNLHPFERSNNGLGPFAFIDAISLPSPALAEANPSAHAVALAQAHSQAREHGVRLGCCDHCGMGIMHHAVIAPADGKRFVVGFDCVAKTNDPSIGKPAEVARAKREREARRIKAEEKREARHQAWLKAVNPETGETNAERLKRESIERAAREAAQRAEDDAVRQRWQFWIDQCRHLSNGGNFVEDIIRGLELHGIEPKGRGLDICAEIFAKQFGRSGSKANDAAVAEFWNKIEN